MEELIAKRYVKALKSVMDQDALSSSADIFSSLSMHFSDTKFVEIMNNPDVEQSVKEEILLSSIVTAKSGIINNLIKLLVEKKRINIIPAMANELRLEMARITKSYQGKVYSDSDIDAKALKGLSKGLGKKVDANVTLEFIKTDFDGIKVEVEDLGIEINFSKNRLNTQLIEHILKAI